MSILKKIYFGLNNVSKVINKIMSVFVAVFVFGCFFSVFLQVLNRYILVKQTLFPWTSLTWTDELARYMLVCLTYASLGMCYKYGHMARVDTIYTRLKPMAKTVLYIAEAVMIFIFLYYACFYGIKLAIANIIYRSQMLEIPGIVLYSIPVFGCLLVAYELLTELIGVISGELEPFSSASPDELEK